MNNQHNHSRSQPQWRSLVGLGEDLRARRISSGELTEHILTRIDHHDPQLHSYATITTATAAEQSARADSELVVHKRIDVCRYASRQRERPT